MKLFISGIGTDVGKSVVSAIFTEALAADYWKPIQSGDLDFSDTMRVKNLVTNPKNHFHREAYRLNHPLSPHTSAEMDGVKIILDHIKVPATENKLIIEGAGGLHVPLNENDTLLDLLEHLAVPVVLVSRNYLGSINHSLLSYDALRSRNIPILGWVFNGPENASGKEFILDYSKLPVLLEIPWIEEVNKECIRAYAKTLKSNLAQLTEIAV